MMKAKWWWLILTAAYAYLICVAVAVSHDWNWMALDYSHSVFLDRWFVNTMQIMTLGFPFLAFAVVLGNFTCNALADAVRGR